MIDHASSPIRIGLDGYNLALPQGTGVATYGRNLAAAIDQLGYPVDLVFGVNIPRKADIDLRESLFFGQLGADVAALSEVADGAALLVDPLDLAALRAGLIAIDGDAALRDRLSHLGRQRARHFAFGPYARRLLSQYGMV